MPRGPMKKVFLLSLLFISSPAFAASHGALASDMDTLGVALALVVVGFLVAGLDHRPGQIQFDHSARR